LEHGHAGYRTWGRCASATPARGDTAELLRAIKAAFPGNGDPHLLRLDRGGAGDAAGRRGLARKPGSVGLPAPGVDLRLSEEGEVCVRSEFLMDGYFEQPEATASALQDGWYHTGDLGALDDEGYVSIVGRARDVLRTGARRCPPGRWERVLAAHPAVAEVAVVGLPDVRWGDVVCAVVVARGGSRRRPERRIVAGALRWAPRHVQAAPAVGGRGGPAPHAGDRSVQRTLLVERSSLAGTELTGTTARVEYSTRLW